ncbi:MAG: hypothetical protein ABSC94_28560 [Polyangiaceae bacterium]|jgi:hypothetical protein
MMRFPQEARVPGPCASWDEIQTFAQTFNGYEAFGTEECGRLANALSEAFKRTGILDADLAHLRNALFFEQRRFRHFGFDPDERAMHYIRALVARIADRVTEDKTEEHMEYTEYERMRDAFGCLKAQLQRIDNSYTNVFGPSVPIKRGTAYIAISGNGAVCFASEALADQMGAQRRPDPPVFLNDHPLGADIGPSYGRFLYGISPEDIARRYPRRKDLAQAVVAAFAKAGLKW